MRQLVFDVAKALLILSLYWHHITLFFDGNVGTIVKLNDINNTYIFIVAFFMVSVCMATYSGAMFVETQVRSILCFDRDKCSVPSPF